MIRVQICPVSTPLFTGWESVQKYNNFLRPREIYASDKNSVSKDVKAGVREKGRKQRVENKGQ